MSGTLNPETPRLSNLPGRKSPIHCQRCSGKFRRDKLKQWQECDHKDEREIKTLLLCEPCSNAVIEQHPRLYHDVGINAPFPGRMEICIGCRRLVNGECTSPQAKQNGGKGVAVDIAQPSRGFWDGVDKSGKRTGGIFEHWIEPARGCSDLLLYEEENND